jgi:transposase
MTTAQQEPSDWREGRRLRAWALKRQNWSQQAIADALGVTSGAVSQWMRRAREGGAEALRRRLAPGSPPKLTTEQRAQLPHLLAQGAEAFGFRGDVWTAKRVRTERWPALKRGPTGKDGPSSGSTSPASTCCPAPSGPTPRAARRRSSACR